MSSVSSEYSILDSSHPEMMLLVPPADPSVKDSWLFGKPFLKPPRQPVIARIRQGQEGSQLLDYFGTARLISNGFHETLLGAGVDNLEVYDAIIRSGDGSVQFGGYKAFNLIGLVSAADMAKTRLSDPDGSRLIDASIETLAIDPDKVRGLLMFRLAEYTGAVIVHARVRQAIEARKFPNIIFREPSEFWS